MESVRTQLEHYLRQPSLENYMRLRDAVTALPDYQPYSDYRSEAYALLTQHKFKELAQYLMPKIPGWLLNPGIHKILSFALHKLGDEEKAQAERALSKALLGAILSTGDGSEAHPYIVSSVTDEYDVLEHLGKSLQQQALVGKEDRRYDRLDCKDGAQIWFDITLPLTHFEKMMRATKQRA